MKHLTDEEREYVNARLPAYPATFVGWPEWAPQQYNGSGEACDMWSGPCLCGAWHKEGR